MIPDGADMYYGRLSGNSDHLGSSSYISTLNGQISQHVEYIAFGEVLFEEHSSSFKSPYLFNGKELDRETNLSYYGARYLDMKTSLWLNVDPLAEKTPNWSPYAFCNNNPLFFTDPTGMSAEPPVEGIPQYIDDSGTYFWDEKKGNYWNSTKGEEYKVTSESKSKGDATYIFNGEGGIQGGFTLTPDRPDYDGKLTLSEANKWYNEGKGEPLYVSSKKMDLSPVETGDFEKGVGGSMYKNFFLSANQETGRIFGTIKLTLDSPNGTVTLGKNGFLDRYDFDQKENNSVGRVIRNIGTVIGETFAGKGTGYDIYTYGKGKVEKTK
ncbi:hypothetical protein DK150_260003 [Flavobacterium psychrophilum]|uniref:RHS repeat domain-containing protein n=1 Tax=Flavobacterium psychrophilum TaxID=96345 RepID=UPI000B7C09E9|nr:RHS repeat-associated core domain-containing protein [Flavobacterium psychrophilum]SNA72387.1 hypothetical protein DK150_260003 [Flavobacterium psychrophilum]